MGIGGRIPPLLEACAPLLRRILSWFDLFTITHAREISDGRTLINDT
jgi:hypothetical protein